MLKICAKRSDQTVKVFHLRLCRLLEGPKRPISAEGTVNEFLGKTHYRDASSNLKHNGALRSAPENLSKFEWNRNGV